LHGESPDGLMAIGKSGENMPANSARILPENVRLLRKQLLELVGQRPVQPFRIHLTDGRAFEVRFPNMTLVMNTFVHVGIPEAGVPDPFVDHSVDVELTAIRGIEMLPGGPSTN
jgi:hypothetical protein